MPLKIDPSETGDLFTTITVDFPTDITEDQKLQFRILLTTQSS